MKIEKIKNYNQKLLAVLGTIGGIFLVVALVSFISIVIQEHRRYDYEEPETGILSEEKIEKLQKENKREQVISYETPILIDTLNSKYIIPTSVCLVKLNGVVGNPLCLSAVSLFAGSIVESGYEPRYPTLPLSLK